ncbi:MAG TPA: hypothetical protein VGG40_08575 [Solirubrobacterales bacterium]|jgi:hypothetical protein
MASDFDNECFLIAPIGDEGSAIRRRSDGVRDFVVGEAAAAHGLATRRADEFGEPGQITSQIVEHCLRARMCVADLTGGNENVYYELSVRHGVQRPVVLIAGHETKLPFDIGQARVIFFDHTDLMSARQAREAVREQIGIALASTVAPENPISNGLRLARLKGDQNGDDAVQLLILERLEGLGGVVRDLDTRMRKTERRDAIRQALRNRRVHGFGDPDSDLVMQHFLDFYDAQRRSEEAKEAEEAGLSPGAYLDDEIVLQEETGAPPQGEDHDEN